MTTRDNSLDAFLQSYYKSRPVCSTFIGVHHFDDLLPSYSGESVDELCIDMEGQLSALTKEHSQDVRRIEDVDCFLAANYLETQLAEFRQLKLHRRNPTLYTGEAVFGLFSLLLPDSTMTEQRLRSLVSRMRLIPRLLEEGKTNLREVPVEWSRKALKDCTGATLFLDKGVKALAQTYGLTSEALREASATALASFQNFNEDLLGRIIPHGTSNYACGKQLFDLLVKKGHCLNMTADEVADYGMRRLNEQEEKVSLEAGKLGQDGNRAAILERIRNNRPSDENYLGVFQSIWEQCVNYVTERNLATWDAPPVDYRYTPEFLAQSAPFLYFLPYRSPPAFGDIGRYPNWVTSLESPVGEKTVPLDFSTIKLNYIVHHGSAGHHLQNSRARKSGLLLGRIAAVDCALRLAMFFSGTMAEGWACYATDLMAEEGFLTPYEAFDQAHSQLRQWARAVVDSRLGTGKMGFGDAVRFYCEKAGMSPEAAHTEVVKNSMFPATGCMYLLGTDLIHKTRDASSKREGSGFSLGSFHDKLLSYGSIPVALIADLMLGESVSLD